MTSPTPQELLAVALKAANIGADILKTYSRNNLQTTLKGEVNNFVTEADLASERAVRDTIRAARPSDAITGEELAADLGTNAKVRWSIDPLDGTVNYTRHLPFYATSVGAQDFETGEWVAGVVVAPELNTTWMAHKGGGAFVERDGIRTQLFGPPKDRASKIMATGFAYTEEIKHQQLIDLVEIMKNFQDLRRDGSAAIDMCHVAEGKLDAYYEKDIKEHDWAAAALIAEEAGVNVVRPTVAGGLCTVGI